MASPTISANVQPIYDMHQRWLSDALSAGDSLLTPGAAVWTLEHLDELEEHFIGQPDLTKDKRFLAKLHDQLANVSPEAVQLMAELHAVHFLIIWNGAISAATKLRDLDAMADPTGERTGPVNFRVHRPQEQRRAGHPHPRTEATRLPTPSTRLATRRHRTRDRLHRAVGRAHGPRRSVYDRGPRRMGAPCWLPQHP